VPAVEAAEEVEEEEEEEEAEEEEGDEEDLLPPPPKAASLLLKRSASALAAAAAARDAAVRSSLALVEVEIPVNALVDGVHARRFAGTAVVVFQSRTLGLALVDRNTAPVASADARLSFGGAPADAATRPAFLHPLHNFALLAYDPSDLEAQGVNVVVVSGEGGASSGSGDEDGGGEGEEAGGGKEKGASPALSCGAVAAVALDEAPLAPGDKLHLCGLSKDGRLVKRDVSVINPNAALAVRRPDVPRFRAVHEEVVRLDHDYGAFSGVLVRNAPRPPAGGDDDGGAGRSPAASSSLSADPFGLSVPRICGVWASYSEQVDREEREFCAGLPSATFARWVSAAAQALDGGVPRSLEEKTSALSLSGSSSSSPIVPSLSVPVLDAELEPLPLVKAAAHGLPRAWVARLAAADADDRRQVGFFLLFLNLFWGVGKVSRGLTGKTKKLKKKRAGAPRQGHGVGVGRGVGADAGRPGAGRGRAGGDVVRRRRGRGVEGCGGGGGGGERKRDVVAVVVADVADALPSADAPPDRLPRRRSPPGLALAPGL